MARNPWNPWLSLNRPFLGFEDLGIRGLARPDLGDLRISGVPTRRILGISGSWDLGILGSEGSGSWDLRI